MLTSCRAVTCTGLGVIWWAGRHDCCIDTEEEENWPAKECGAKGSGCFGEAGSFSSSLLFSPGAVISAEIGHKYNRRLWTRCLDATWDGWAGRWMIAGVVVWYPWSHMEFPPSPYREASSCQRAAGERWKPDRALPEYKILAEPLEAPNLACHAVFKMRIDRIGNVGQHTMLEAVLETVALSSTRHRRDVRAWGIEKWRRRRRCGCLTRLQLQQNAQLPWLPSTSARLAVVLRRRSH